MAKHPDLIMHHDDINDFVVTAVVPHFATEEAKARFLKAFAGSTSSAIIPHVTGSFGYQNAIPLGIVESRLPERSVSKLLEKFEEAGLKATGLHAGTQFCSILPFCRNKAFLHLTLSAV